MYAQCSVHVPCTYMPVSGNPIHSMYAFDNVIISCFTIRLCIMLFRHAAYGGAFAVYHEGEWAW